MASGIKPTALSTRTATIILAALAIIIGIYPLVARPDLVRAGVFLFLDEGHALLSATIINGGGHLYRDLYTPYGPLPAWMWAGIARVAGNTPTAFGVMHVFFNTATLLLVFGTLRRTLTPAWALAFAVVCVLPSVIIRGQIFGGMWVNTYVTVERAVIAGLLFAWRPPIERSFARSFVLGALLGTLQWIKFGTVAFIGAGFVAAEAWSLWSDGRTRAAWRQVGMALVAAAFVEGLMVAWAVASLPWPMARDVIWPSFGVRMYQTPTLAPRYPPLAPQVFFFRRDVGVTCGVVLGAILLWRERRARSACGRVHRPLSARVSLLRLRLVAHHARRTHDGAAVVAFPGGHPPLLCACRVLYAAINALVSCAGGMDHDTAVWSALRHERSRRGRACH